MDFSSLETIAERIARENGPPSCILSINDEVRVDRKGVLKFIQTLTCPSTSRSSFLAIKTLQFSPNSLQELVRLCIADSGCDWSVFCSSISAFQNLERVVILFGSTSRFLLEHQLEDLMEIISGLSRFKCFEARSRVNLGSDGLDRLSKALDGLTSIEELVLTNLCLDIKDTDAVAAMDILLTKMCDPSLHLKRLHLEQCCFSMKQPISTKGCQLIFRAKSLRDVALRNMGLRRTQLRVVAEELARNVVVERIDFRGEECNSAVGYYDLLAAMQTQYYVKDFKIYCPRELEFVDELSWPETEKKQQYASMIDSFTALNAAGRRRIIQDEKGCRDDWLSLIIIARHDMNALFNILICTPKLCELQPLHGGSLPPKQRRSTYQK